MSIRKFICCDICNPQGLKMIEFRRAPRAGRRSGRRISDSCSWYEGELNSAIEQEGWVSNEEGEHICPACQKNRQ